MTMMMEKPDPLLTHTNAQIRQLLHDSRRVVIASHIRPDGDAIGSTLGLGLALQKAGKEVRMVLADGVPGNFRFLPGANQIHRSTPLDQLSSYDTVIVVDASDLQRVGNVLGDFNSGHSNPTGRVPDLNIDHHITNLNYAGLNLVVPTQVATCAIIAENLPEWGLDYDEAIATALLTGIVTDTIGFRTSNMNPSALRLSAMLMELGADLPNLYERSLVSKTFEAARYWGQGLVKLQREIIPGTESGMVWTSLTLLDRQEASYPGNDDADLVNILSTIDCDVAVIFVEQKSGHVKISWRARPGFDVSQIALQFGGGGHAAASGADISGALDNIREQVLAATRDMLAALSRRKDNDEKNPVHS